jgi:hypothetical protein
MRQATLGRCDLDMSGLVFVGRQSPGRGSVYDSTTGGTCKGMVIRNEVQHVSAITTP